MVPLCSAPDLPFEVLTATMFAFSGLGETQKASLAPRDIEDFCEIYPLASDPGTCAAATPRDAGPPDGGARDAGTDATAPDARVADATVPDAAMPDGSSGERDASVLDAGTPPPAEDASTPMDAARRSDAALHTVPAEDDGCTAPPGRPRAPPVALVVLGLCALAAAHRRRRRASHGFRPREPRVS